MSDAREKADKAGAVMLIASVLKMGAHIAGRTAIMGNDAYPPALAVQDAIGLYDEVVKQCGVAPAKAF